MAANLQNMPPLPSSTTQQATTRQNNNPFQANYTPPAFRGSALHTSHQSTSSRNTNPFRTPTHSPHTSESSNNLVLSPVSPVDHTELDSRLRTPRPPATSNRAPRAVTKMSSEPRKSTDLRKLDGNPYPGADNQQDAKPRKFKVAQDMYAGDMPPGYDSQGYQGPLAQKTGGGAACHKCGGHRKTESELSNASGSAEKAPGHSHDLDCQKCGHKKSTPPSSYPRSAMANAQPRSQSQPLPQGPSRAGPVQSSEAGPSGHRHKCGKCGRKRRPESISSSSSQPQSPPQGIFAPRVPQIQTNGVPVVSFEPPTAVTERAPTLPYSPATTQEPLIKHENVRPTYQKGHSPSRSGSFSALFRSLSRRNKTANGPLPSQQLASTGEQNPNSIVDKISHAIGDGKHSRGESLGVNRPPSPLSFVDQPREEQAFEMNDMRNSKQPQRRDSWDKADESTKFLSDTSDSERPVSRPAHNRSQSTQDHLRGPANQGDDIFLALPPDQRPGITRFKSLRNGVNRAADGLSRSASQISRSTSLRRLESVKKVPQFWYRDDMVIDGAGGEYNTYAY